MMNINTLMAQFQQFRQVFQGDPRQQIQQMLNSGRVTQAQYDQAVKTANQIQKMFNDGSARQVRIDG